MKGIRCAEVARALGVSHAAVIQAWKRGRIPRHDDGSYDLDACMAGFGQSGQARKRALTAAATGKATPVNAAARKAVAAPQASAKPAAAVAAAAVERVLGETDEAFQLRELESMSHTEALRREQCLKVAERAIKVRKTGGVLVEIGPVNAWVSGMIVRARGILMRLGPELAEDLAGMDDAVEIERMITDRVRQVLGQLAEYRHAA